MIKKLVIFNEKGSVIAMKEVNRMGQREIAFTAKISSPSGAEENK
jgi:hypothetical protein